MQNVTLEDAGGWVPETSLGSIFVIHYKSIIISYLKGNKQADKRKTGASRAWMFLELWFLFLVLSGRRRFLSIYGKDGGSAPWGPHLKQHYSRPGEAWGPRGPQGKGLLLGAPDLQLEKPSMSMDQPSGR